MTEEDTWRPIFWLNLSLIQIMWKWRFTPARVKMNRCRHINDFRLPGPPHYTVWDVGWTTESNYSSVRMHKFSFKGSGAIVKKTKINYRAAVKRSICLVIFKI